MLVMVKAGRARRNGKVTTVRSGTLAKASKGACSWVETAKLSAQELGGTLGISSVLADQKVPVSPWGVVTDHCPSTCSCASLQLIYMN